MIEFEKKEAQIVEWIDEWCHINSHSYNIQGLEKMAETLTKVFAPLADTSEAIALQPIERFDAHGKLHTQSIGTLLSFKKRPSAPLQILFCGHYDTVYPKEHPFQNVVIIDNEKICGPGVADMKGGIALILAILQTFETSEFAENVGWEVILSPDEEIGSPSSAAYLQQRAPHFHYGLVFEPGMADGAITSYRPASSVYEVIIQGQAAHLGRDPQKGRSAIIAASDLTLKLQSILSIEEHKLVNVGVFQGGTAVNTIPAVAKLDVNFRSLTDKDLEEMTEMALQFSLDVEKAHQVSIQWEQCTLRPAKPLDKKLEEMITTYKKLAHELNIPLSFHPSGGVCDGNILAASGLPNLDTLGPVGHHLHSPDEYLEYPSLIERGKLTLHFLLSKAKRG